MTSYFIRSFWLILALSVALPNARGGEEEIRRFRDEYPAACARIQDAYAQLSGTIQMDAGKNGGPIRSQNVRFQNASDRSLARVETGDKREIILCVRPEGHYALNRKADGKEYGVVQIGLMAEAMFARNVGQYLRAPYSFLGEPFDRLVSDPTFRVLSAEPVSSGDRHGIEVTYAFGEKQSVTPTTRIIPQHEGTLLFDSDRNWVILRGSIRLADRPPEKAISFSVDYAEAAGSVPLVSLVTYVENGRATKCRFASLSSSVAEPASFSMTAFGLPDISAAARNRTNWMPYVLAAAALLALAIGLWLRRLARRPRFAVQAG